MVVNKIIPKRYKSISLLIAFTFIAFIPFFYGQTYNRIEAEFTLKEKKADGTQQLSLGHVYYDIQYGKIVYDITFPQKSIMIMTNDAMVIMKDDSVVNKKRANHLVRFSIFNLCVKGSLPHFGLKETPFELKNIEKEDDMVISTWELPEKQIEEKSKILLSHIDKQLQGIVTYGKDEEIISKQFFEQYTTIKGLNFPKRVVHFMYTDTDKKNIRITTYKNIKINHSGNEAYYNYTIPGN